MSPFGVVNDLGLKVTRIPARNAAYSTVTWASIGLRVLGGRQVVQSETNGMRAMIDSIATLISAPESWFVAKLSLDGLLTFLGGLLAFFAILYQVRRSDRGLQQQMNAERRAREDEAEDRRRRVAIALLFELDSHYKSRVRDLLKLFEGQRNDSPPLVVKPTGAYAFPVYVGNASVLGGLPPVLVETIVNYYGLLRSYEATLGQYTQGYEMTLAGDSPIGRALMAALVPRIKSEAAATTQSAYTACGLLCRFVDIEFRSPRIGVADDPHVDQSAHQNLTAATTQLLKEMQRQSLAGQVSAP